MIKDENEEKIPLLDILDDAMRNVFKSAKAEDRKINQKQWAVMEDVCKTLSDIIGVEAKVVTYPEFSAGYVRIVVSNVSLNATELKRY